MTVWAVVFDHSSTRLSTDGNSNGLTIGAAATPAAAVAAAAAAVVRESWANNKTVAARTKNPKAKSVVVTTLHIAVTMSD